MFLHHMILQIIVPCHPQTTLLSPDSGGLGVIPALEPVTEAGGTGNDILQSAADFHNLSVRDYGDPETSPMVKQPSSDSLPEVVSLEEQLEVPSHLGVLRTDRSLAELLVRYLGVKQVWRTIH